MTRREILEAAQDILSLQDYRYTLTDIMVTETVRNIGYLVKNKQISHLDEEYEKWVDSDETDR